MKDAFRRVMGRFPQGVTVITMSDGEVEHGMTASSVTSLSVDPPTFLICVKRTARAHDIVPRAGSFAVNILAADQADTCMTFAQDDLSDEQRWATVTTHKGPGGAPRIDGCVAYIECRLTETFPGGTHTIYIGEVTDVADGTGAEPLVWHGGGPRELVPVAG